MTMLPATWQEEEMSEVERRFKRERGGGNYGIGTKELQAQNYAARKEAEQKRRELFDQALSKFKKNDIEGVWLGCSKLLLWCPEQPQLDGRRKDYRQYLGVLPLLMLCSSCHDTTMICSTCLEWFQTVFECQHSDGQRHSSVKGVLFWQALIDFEEVISMEPKNYLGDDFSRITQIFRVAHYNVACCYSAINQVQHGPRSRALLGTDARLPCKCASNWFAPRFCLINNCQFWRLLASMSLPAWGQC
jgi:hypothetical protein